MNTVIPFDRKNSNHVNAVLKLSKKNKFYYDDIYTNLLRVPPNDKKLLEKLNMDYNCYSKAVEEYYKGAPFLFGFLITTEMENGKKGICGFILGDEPKGNFINLHFLLIDKKYRRLGYASQLMESFLKSVKSGVALEIKTESMEPIKLYNKFGFYQNDVIDSFKYLTGGLNGKYTYLYKTT